MISNEELTSKPPPAVVGGYALMSDGETVLIRPAMTGDFDAVRAMHEAMSPDNSYLRFFRLGGPRIGPDLAWEPRVTRNRREDGKDLLPPLADPDRAVRGPVFLIPNGSSCLRQHHRHLA